MTAIEREDLQAVERALSRTITHLVASADATPYADDPRWSPWTRFQKPLIDRCAEARAKVKAALGDAR